MIFFMLVSLFVSKGFVIYPQKGMNVEILKEDIVQACGEDAYVKYFSVGEVFILRKCDTSNLKGFKGIERIEKERRYRLPKFTVEKTIYEMDTLPWYVNNIHMYDREKLGLSGKNVVCGILDTGIDTSDSYLKESFSGYFFDAVSDSTIPYDDNGHGTAVASLITGEYGIAPSTKIAVCKGFSANGSSTDEDILECAEWFYNLKKNGVNLQVVNNSWGEEEAAYMFNIILSWDSLGILSAFSAGNNGPYSGFIDAPSVYPITFSIGATTSDDTLAWFSSRGPAPDTGIFTHTEYWPIPDWNYTKPDFVAPGEYIYITLPGGLHGIASGTSLSTPIFSGVMCLLKEANPDITYKEAYRLIKNHAALRKNGIFYPDTGYGFGRIDIGLLVNYLEPKITYDTITLLNFPQGINGSYRIYTQDGRLIKRGYLPLYNINALLRRSGAYLMTVQTGKNTYHLKFVVIK